MLCLYFGFGGGNQKASGWLLFSSLCRLPRGGVIEVALELVMAVFRSASAGDIVCLWSLWKSSRGLQLAIAFFCVVWFCWFDSVK